MRCYLHYEGPLGPSHTKRVSAKEGEVLLASKALATFVASYKDAHGSTSMAIESMTLTCNGKAVDLNAPLTIKDKSDVNVEPLPGGASAKASSSAAGSEAASLQATKPAESLPAAKATATTKKAESASKLVPKAPAAAPTSKVSSTSTSAEQNAVTAADLMSKGRLREARLVLERGLLAEPQHAPSLKALGEVAARKGNDLQAAECYGQASDAYQKMGNSKGVKVEDGAVAALLGQGKALCKLGDLGRAIACCQMGLRLLESAPNSKSASAQLAAVDLKVAMAECLLESGRAQEAADLTIAALAAPEHAGHVDGLLCYAAIAEKHERNEEALGVLLRLVVANQTHRGGKKLLAKVLCRKPASPPHSPLSGVALLQSLVPLNSASASAYAFLATCVKDHGAVDTCAELLGLALKQAPGNHSYALNLLHAHEIRCDYSAAYTIARDHLLGLKSCGSLVGMTASSLKEASVCKHSSLSALIEHGVSEEQGTWSVAWHDDKKKKKGSSPFAVVTFTQGGNRAESDANAPKKVTLDEASLDLLALLFALVKIFFLCGAHTAAVELIALIEPSRRASSAELHTTTIRNEHAYYCCSAQCLAAQGTALRSHTTSSSSLSSRVSGVSPNDGTHSACTEAAPPPLFVCGDSHSLSPGWQPVGDRFLVPKLVTGLKHWHLRPEGDFYPKVNFERCMAGLPRRCNVVFIFGEIDCREGILVAIEKDRYSSVDEGMLATLAHYTAALLALVKTKGNQFRVLVHPIVPVLDETRPLVERYNELLQTHIDALKHPNIVFLKDIFDNLLTESTGPSGNSPAAEVKAVAAGDGTFMKGSTRRLKTEFKLDGTHLHPKYVQALLAPALTKALA